MRVIAGTLKGRQLRGARWAGLRPTSDKLRETLFNVVAARVAGARVLDVFAGTGAIGIEALSRGAAEVIFVEDDRRASALIAENLRLCGLTAGYTVSRSSWAEVARRLVGQLFDLILLDPPYEQPDLEGVLRPIPDLLADRGLAVLEHAKRRSLPIPPAGLTRTRLLVSGDSALAFYEREPLV